MNMSALAACCKFWSVHWRTPYFFSEPMSSITKRALDVHQSQIILQGRISVGVLSAQLKHSVELVRWQKCKKSCTYQRHCIILHRMYCIALHPLFVPVHSLAVLLMMWVIDLCYNRWCESAMGIIKYSAISEDVLCTSVGNKKMKYLLNMIDVVLV